MFVCRIDCGRVAVVGSKWKTQAVTNLYRATTRAPLRRRASHRPSGGVSSEASSTRLTSCIALRCLCARLRLIDESRELGLAATVGERRLARHGVGVDEGRASVRSRARSARVDASRARAHRACGHARVCRSDLTSLSPAAAGGGGAASSRSARTAAKSGRGAALRRRRGRAARGARQRHRATSSSLCASSSTAAALRPHAAASASRNSSAAQRRPPSAARRDARVRWRRRRALPARPTPPGRRRAPTASRRAARRRRQRVLERGGRPAGDHRPNGQADDANAVRVEHPQRPRRRRAVELDEHRASSVVGGNARPQRRRSPRRVRAEHVNVQAASQHARAGRASARPTPSLLSQPLQR